MRVLEVPARKRPIHTGLRAALFKNQTIYSVSTLPKDKAASRRQYEQYGKAKPTPYFGKGSRYFRKARGGLAEARA